MHGCMCIFGGECGMHSDKCFERHACAGVYVNRCVVKQVLRASAYTFAYALATGCAYALMYVHFVAEERGWVGSTNLWGNLLLGVGGYFWQLERWGVVCVFSIFDAGASLCGCICVCTHTHTHTAQMEYSVVSPKVGMRHLEGPENPRWTKSRHTYIRICVKSQHVCIC